MTRNVTEVIAERVPFEIRTSESGRGFVLLDRSVVERFAIDEWNRRGGGGPKA